MSEEKTYTTKEVSELLNVGMKTLQYWIRKGFVTPAINGEGRQRRATWTEADVEAARAYSSEEGHSQKAREIRDSLLEQFGDGVIAAFNRAAALPCPPGAVRCAGPRGERLVQTKDTVGTLLRRIGGSGIILPPQ